MGTKIDETELMAAFKNGDQLAFKTIFDLYYKDVVRLISYKTQDKEIAKDIVAEAFAKLWEKRANFHSLRHTKCFVVIVSINKLKNFWKKARWNQSNMISIDEIEIVDHEPSKALILTELLRLVTEYCKHLSPQRAKIIQMYVAGMNESSISTELGVSRKTVRNQRNRAVHQMRIELLAKAKAIIC